MATNHRQRPAKTTLALALGVLIAAAITALPAGAAGSTAAGSSRPSAVQVIRISTHAFDWGDAGIGAAAGIGISMLAVGATLLITGARRKPKPLPRLTAKQQR